LAEAGGGEVGGRDGQEGGLNHPAAAFSAEGAVPGGGFLRKGVVEVGQDEAAAAWEAEKEALAESGGQCTQKRFGGVGEEPTEKFE
jgi:hypothetical protein